jgi:hypothetical protein
MGRDRSYREYGSDRSGTVHCSGSGDGDVDGSVFGLCWGVEEETGD